MSVMPHMGLIWISASKDRCSARTAYCLLAVSPQKASRLLGESIDVGSDRFGVLIATEAWAKVVHHDPKDIGATRFLSRIALCDSIGGGCKPNDPKQHAQSCSLHDRAMHDRSRKAIDERSKERDWLFHNHTG